MYKVFCDSVKILLVSNVEFVNFHDDLGEEISLPDLISRIRNAQLNSNYYVVSDRLMEEIHEFESSFVLKTAAGGWVLNIENELLMIKRNGFWDIPKGHLEKNESIEQCAVREVQEETGVDGLNIVSFLGFERHIYFEKNAWVLKTTHWYSMLTDFNMPLLPQLEEGIEEVRWVKKQEICQILGWMSLRTFYSDFVNYNEVDY